MENLRSKCVYEYTLKNGNSFDKTLKRLNKLASTVQLEIKLERNDMYRLE